MEVSAADKWQLCLNHIKANVPPKEFATWFEPLTFAEYHEGWLAIYVPTKYVGDYIRDNYRELVSRAVQKIFGKQTQLTLRNREAIDQWRKQQEEKTRREKQAGEIHRQQTPQTLPELPPVRHNLNAFYTFDNFVEGESNKLARAVAYSIAEKPGQITFNPFFLYGPSGVGKTHLVNALGLRLHELYPEKRVLFVSAHVFKTQFTDAIIHNTSNDFINFYQSIDVLIIDDIQEITTAKTQQAFFHIFNHLQQNRRQLVITCDRPPALFEGIEERMLTRFKWGMVAEMEKPDVALRKAILLSKIRRDGLTIPIDVVQYIATNVNSSVRELEGIINGLMAYSIVENCNIDVPLTARVVGRIVNLERHEITTDDIMNAVCRHCCVKPRDITSKTRKQSIVIARQLTMHLYHKYTELSYTQIGRMLGGRDHSTILHGCNQVTRRLSVDKAFRHEVEEIESNLKK